MDEERFDCPDWRRTGRGTHAVILSLPVDDASLEESEEIWRCDHVHLGSRSAMACAMAEIKRRWAEEAT